MNDALTRPQTLREGLESLDYVGAPESIKAGALLGPYRLLKLLGEGGMGAVWLADQLEPFERKVAIKFAHAAASSQNQAYLEIERQALARMVHPYIAQIYDAGATAHGALFFVMEYVEGVELEHQLAQPAPTKRADVGLRDAVTLMKKICEGAHYAHQRGLIHRDLKPSNVLVTQLAGAAIPKIIDFGIAVGMDPSRGSAQAGTAGTLAYMAPEQLKPTAEGIDVRADVHALGVILVELLSHAQGKRVHLEQAVSIREILDTRYKSTLEGKQLQDQQQSRKRLKAAAAIGLIPRELRAIARKATAEERNQRYDSAAALADDLQRWLDRRPVQAIAQGRWYAFSCFVNRYRIASALGAMTLLALVVGLVVASYGLREAKAARALADARRAQAEGLIGYMLGDFSTKLESIGKFELFDGVATRALDYLRQANDQDAISATHRATALRTIGDIQMRRGQLDAAQATFLLANEAMEQAEAFGPPTAPVFFERAQVAFWLGNRAFVERDFAAASIHWRDYLRYARAMEQLVPGDGKAINEVASAQINLGVLAFQTNDLRLAQQSFQGAVALLEQMTEKDTAALQTLAEAISWQARTEEAGGLLASAKKSYFTQLEIIRVLEERNSDSTSWKFKAAITEHLVALIALQLGEVTESISFLESAAGTFSKLVLLEAQNLDMKRRLAICYTNLAWAYKSQNRESEALESIEKAVAIFSKEQGGEDPLNWKLAEATTMLRAGQIMPNSDRADHFLNQSIVTLERLSASGDLNIRVYTALAYARLLGEKISISEKELIDGLVKYSNKNKSAEVLDVLYRIYRNKGEEAEARRVQMQLNDMGYRHPDFLAFIDSHPGEQNE